LLGDFDAARRNLAESRRIAHLCGDVQGEAKCLGALGRLHQMTGDYPQAIAHSQASLEVGKRLGDPLVVVEGLLQLMDTHRLAGDPRSSADARTTARSEAQGYPHLQRTIRDHSASPPLAPQDRRSMREAIILYWRQRYRKLLAVDLVFGVLAGARDHRAFSRADEPRPAMVACAARRRRRRVGCAVRQMGGPQRRRALAARQAQREHRRGKSARCSARSPAHESFRRIVCDCGCHSLAFCDSLAGSFRTAARTSLKPNDLRISSPALKVGSACHSATSGRAQGKSDRL
jgi:hypothetical protein